ncbi:MAG: AraC family transcriptional regulator [Jatrophihabitans sp.]|nr:AraC family transcriptional regulator [Jatrophihabitans sp.]
MHLSSVGPSPIVSGIIVRVSAKTANLSRRPHRVSALVCDGLALFEFGVACEVFGYTEAVDDLGVDWYDFTVCAATPSVTTENGLHLQVSHGLDQLRRADTIVVPAFGPRREVPDDVVQALRRAHRRGARVVSLCTGAFLLAAAGLLDGRRVTTHWAECGELARRYPLIMVDPSVLYLDDGDILTSAGSAAGIDLCLHVVRSDHGADVAARLARQLVVPPYRDGGQAQYIETPLPEVHAADLFADTIAWMQAHLDHAITVADLAARSAMSRRTFARRFAAATGTTPYQWQLRQRLQLAQRLLETTDSPVDVVAERSGFIHAGNLRKHFGRVVRTTPQAYRHAFQARTASPQSSSR